jgi:hypothetical protein
MVTITDARSGLILGLLLAGLPGSPWAVPDGEPAGHRHPPSAETPRWDAAAIRASHVVHPEPEGETAAPPRSGDTRFLVVESGGRYASLVDGERFEVIHRWATRPGLRGAPRFSADGRFVYLSSAGGWIAKYDLHRLGMVAEIRAGASSRNVALSGDGRYLLVANEQPHTLVVLDARDLALRERIEVRDDAGKSSRVSAVHDAPARSSFIVALSDIPELWELRYDEGAPPVYPGLVHDFRLGEGVPVPGDFPPRRVRLDAPLADLLFDPDQLYVLGIVAGGSRIQAVDLDTRRRLATLDLPGLPRTGAAVRWQQDGRTLLALPNQSEGLLIILDEVNWKPVKVIDTPGPGAFMASHAGNPYLWLGGFPGPHQDAVLIIDKRSLEIVQTLRPEPGKRAAHLAFGADGRHVLVSVGEDAGAILVYDSRRLEEVARIPMRRPAGIHPVAVPWIPGS